MHEFAEHHVVTRFGQKRGPCLRGASPAGRHTCPREIASCEEGIYYHLADVAPTTDSCDSTVSLSDPITNLCSARISLSPITRSSLPAGMHGTNHPGSDVSSDPLKSWAQASVQEPQPHPQALRISDRGNVT